MATDVTHRGQQMALGSLAGGGIIIQATRIKLYLSSSTPNKDGTGFNEVANGNGYLTNGLAVVVGDWINDLFTGNRRSRLKPGGNDPVWIASGGSILNVAGAYLTDATGALAWWPRPGGAINLAPGEDLTLQDIGLIGT